MTEAVNAAGTRSEVDRRSDVLKVFIAPEFYFRSMYGGYTDMKYFSGEGAGRDPNSIIGGLANAVQDELWKDWLFVFGTSGRCGRAVHLAGDQQPRPLTQNCGAQHRAGAEGLLRHRGRTDFEGRCRGQGL